MARAILGFLVVGMLSLTGYYAYSTIGHCDDTPSATTLGSVKTSCCTETATKCCSETGDAAGCTGVCPHTAATTDAACPSEGGCCTKDKAKVAETTKKE